MPWFYPVPTQREVTQLGRIDLCLPDQAASEEIHVPKTNVAAATRTTESGYQVLSTDLLLTNNPLHLKICTLTVDKLTPSLP